MNRWITCHCESRVRSIQDARTVWRSLLPFCLLANVRVKQRETREVFPGKDGRTVVTYVSNRLWQKSVIVKLCRSLADLASLPATNRNPESRVSVRSPRICTVCFSQVLVAIGRGTVEFPSYKIASLCVRNGARQGNLLCREGMRIVRDVYLATENGLIRQRFDLSSFAISRTRGSAEVVGKTGRCGLAFQLVDEHRGRRRNFELVILLRLALAGYGEQTLLD